MAETKVSGKTKEIIISSEKPTVLIGERINPTGRKKLSAELQKGNLDIIEKEALEQVSAGADIIDVNVGATGVDEVVLLPEAISRLMEKIDVPLCLDSSNPKALAKALEIYQGKALVNSVKGEESSLKTILPLIKEYNAAVIALPVDEAGIPFTVEKRLEISAKILNAAELLGISKENIIIDCLALTLGTNDQAGKIVLATIENIKEKLDVNITVGASNISFGLPDRNLINNVFLAAAISKGLTCPIVDVAAVIQSVLAIDLVLGKDRFALRYVKNYRRKKAEGGGGCIKSLT
ncbi:MAG: dihydropteroate synthase [Firmicutes bacterium]|nr:dihydropteroate synthase [Bacillota bacterium]